jgi:hypothetical protein
MAYRETDRCEVILSRGTGDRFSTLVEPIGTEADRIAMDAQICRQRLIEVVTAGLSAPAQGATHAQGLFNERDVIANKDFLRSDMLFHIVEQCGNFKDESLQLSGGARFADHRAKANSIAPLAMEIFSDWYGGRFGGNAIVGFVNGTKRVPKVAKGDVLAGGGVDQCLVQTIRTVAVRQ